MWDKHMPNTRKKFFFTAGRCHFPASCSLIFVTLWWYLTESLNKNKLKSMTFILKIYKLSNFELKEYNALDFEIKITTRSIFNFKKIQRVRFWIWIFSTCQILIKIFAFRKSHFGSFYSVKTLYFTFFWCFLNSIILKKTKTTCHILNWGVCSSDFESNFFHLF